AHLRRQATSLGHTPCRGLRRIAGAALPHQGPAHRRNHMGLDVPSALTSANRWVDFIVGSGAGIQKGGGSISSWTQWSTRGRPEEPAIIRVPTKHVTVSLSWQRLVPCTSSAGTSPDD